MIVPCGLSAHPEVVVVSYTISDKRLKVDGFEDTVPFALVQALWGFLSQLIAFCFRGLSVARAIY